MGVVDPYGVPFTAGRAESADSYGRILHQVLAFAGDPIGESDRVLEEDPAFVLGHLVKAAVFAWSLHPGFVARARAELEALSGARRMLPHEAALADVVRAWIEGDYGRARSGFDAILEAEPRHLLALFFAHQADFFTAQVEALRERPRRTLEALPPDLPGHGFVLGMFAFGLEETGAFEEAEEAGRTAVEENPRDVWALHAVGHVLEEQGRTEQGIEWYRSREADWGENSYFSVHNSWHWALYHLDREEYEAAFAIYDRRIAPGRRSILLNLCDAASFLWRIHLAGVPAGGRWERLAELFEAKYRPGCHVFDDVHAMLTFAATGDGDRCRLLLRELEALASEQGERARQLRLAGIPICRAIGAFCAGRYDEALDHLERLGPHARLMTGSHAQRDVLELTRIEAAIRAGRAEHARSLLAERLRRRPESRRVLRDLERIFV